MKSFNQFQKGAWWKQLTKTQQLKYLKKHTQSKKYLDYFNRLKPENTGKLSTKEKILALAQKDDLYFFAEFLATWVEGRLMNKRNETYQRRVWNALLEVGKHYHTSNVKGDIYRLCLIPDAKLPKKELIGTSMDLTGNYPMQSWSVSEDGARAVYRQVYQNRGDKYGRPQGYKFAIVKAKASDVKQVITYPEIVKFWDDLESNYKLVYNTSESIKNWFGTRKVSDARIKKLIREIPSAFGMSGGAQSLRQAWYERQKEIVCIVPDNIQAEIVHVF